MQHGAFWKSFFFDFIWTSILKWRMRVFVSDPLDGRWHFFINLDQKLEGVSQLYGKNDLIVSTHDNLYFCEILFHPSSAQPFLEWCTLKVESFAGRNFRRDKLSRMPMVKIKFLGD